MDARTLMKGAAYGLIAIGLMFLGAGWKGGLKVPTAIGLVLMLLGLGLIGIEHILRIREI